MDIQKFNNLLKPKVALANSYEKRNDIDSAVKLWLEITEITIEFSKSKGIDASFKMMLINRTKGILEHIKKLKAGQVEEKLIEEDFYIPEEELLEEKAVEIPKKEKAIIPMKKEIPTSDQVQPKKSEIVEESNFESIPEGFKELHISKEFKIITPHDENYVEKHRTQTSNTTQNQGSQSDSERFDFEQLEEGENLICFACGYDKNKKDAKVCKSCGTSLN